MGAADEQRFARCRGDAAVALVDNVEFGRGDGDDGAVAEMKERFEAASAMNEFSGGAAEGEQAQEWMVGVACEATPGLEGSRRTAMVEEELFEGSMEAFVDRIAAAEGGPHLLQHRWVEGRPVETVDDRLGDHRMHGATFGTTRHMAQIYKRFRRGSVRVGDMELRGTRVLVTGGTSGVGRELVRRFVSLDCRVATCGRDPERLALLTDEFPGVLVAPVDLGSAGAGAALVSEVVREFGGIDVVINNAAVQEHDAFVGSQLPGLAERIEREVATNVVAPMQITAAVLAQAAGRRVAT